MNETTKYTWALFQSQFSKALTALFESYPSDVATLKPSQLILRYVNAIPYDGAPEALFSFLSTNLHTDIRVDSPTGPGSDCAPHGLNLNLQIPSDHPPAMLALSFSTGVSSGKRAIIWQLTGQSLPGSIPATQQEIEGWLNEIHAVLERWFFTLARDELMHRFEGES